MTKITKLALIGAVLVSTISAASAQNFYGSHNNSPDFYATQKGSPADEPNKTDVGENG
jgi:hypothetical protein